MAWLIRAAVLVNREVERTENTVWVRARSSAPLGFLRVEPLTQTEELDSLSTSDTLETGLLSVLSRSGLSHLSLQEKAPGSSIFLTHAEGCRRRAGRVIDGELSIHSLCLRWLVKVPLQFTTQPFTERIHSFAHQLMITSLTGCCQCTGHTGIADQHGGEPR
ncbi:hypothetical protein SRHO_G00108590 [Serrasalmus rhombeus]